MWLEQRRRISGRSCSRSVEFYAFERVCTSTCKRGGVESALTYSNAVWGKTTALVHILRERQLFLLRGRFTARPGYPAVPQFSRVPSCVTSSRTELQRLRMASRRPRHRDPRRKWRLGQPTRHSPTASSFAREAKSLLTGEASGVSNDELSSAGGAAALPTCPARVGWRQYMSRQHPFA